MWPGSYWRTLLQQIKEQFPAIQIVQLGVAPNPRYEQADINLVGETVRTDLPDLLQGARVHIDTESGLVHLAQGTGTPCVVLFGPSDVRFFSYANNANLTAGTCGGCMWMKPDWMTHCPLGNDPIVCMTALKPQRVFQAVKETLIS